VSWDITTDYHCGGSNVSPLEDGTLEDGTAYGWIPEDEGETVEACKDKCMASTSCTAFVWRDSDRGCFWKTGSSQSTLNSMAGHDCYIYSAPDNYIDEDDLTKLVLGVGRGNLENMGDNFIDFSYFLVKWFINGTYF
jgi:hypothetical protein